MGGGRFHGVFANLKYKNINFSILWNLFPKIKHNSTKKDVSDNTFYMVQVPLYRGCKWKMVVNSFRASEVIPEVI